MSPDVFISYSSQDAAVAEAAREALESAGIRCWIAPRDIAPGQDWSAAIIDALESCRVFLLIFSAHSNESEQVKREVQNAVGQRLPVLPFRIEDVVLTRQMRYFIGTPHWLDAVSPPLEPHLERLVAAVRQLLSGQELEPTSSAPPVPALVPAPRHNLPQALSNFIGRVREIEEIKNLLAQARLVTLCGAGGCGKTRLALAVAHEIGEGFQDGAWLVEMETITSPSLVAQAVANVLEVREAADRPLEDTLVQALRARQLLLVLDNCEQVVEAVARLAQKLLQSCPQLRVLATSREPLGIAGESLWRVPSLPLPDLDHLLPFEELQSFEVVQLFVERARAQAPSFALTPQNAPAVAQICCRLDGIPLAIELASARVKVMPPEKIAERLNDRFRLLTGGSRTALPRQQTLRAAIDWSYDLLGQDERTLLERAAIFVGGWTFEAALAICPGDNLDEYEVLDTLSQLVDKSLVMREEGASGEGRYRLLESVRQYGRDKLRADGEEEALCTRHAAWFLEWAAATAPEFNGAAEESGGAGWMARLETEEANLRAALEFLLARGAAPDAARLCLALAAYWERQGWFSESRAALARCLAREDEITDARRRAKLRLTAGWFAYLQGDLSEAMAHQERALELYRAAGDEDGEADILNNLGVTAYARGNAAQARACLHSALAIARRSGDLGKQTERLSNLALLEISEAQYDRAQELLEEAREACRRGRDDHGTAGCLCNLAELALRRRDWTAAIAYSRQSLELFRGFKDQRGIAFTLANLCEAASHAASQAASHGENLAAQDEIAAWLQEALSICVGTGMHWLVPPLFETRARWLAASPEASPKSTHDAFFSLAAATRLRAELELPRSAEDQAEIEAIEAALCATLGDEAVNVLRVEAEKQMSGGVAEITARVLGTA